MSYRITLENLRRQMQQEVEPVAPAQAPRPKGLGSPRRVAPQELSPQYEPLQFTKDMFKSIETARKQFEADMDQMEAREALTSAPSLGESISQALSPSGGEDTYVPTEALTETPVTTSEGVPVARAGEDTPRPERIGTIRDVHVDLEEYDLPESDLRAVAQSIKDIESSGGNYDARGTRVTGGRYRGQRAMGAYQVMPGNLSGIDSSLGDRGWDMLALGRPVSEEEFMSSPTIQDTIFFDQMARTYRRFGNWEDVASVWFTGQPLRNARGRRDDNRMEASNYVGIFSNRFNRYRGAARG